MSFQPAPARKRLVAGRPVGQFVPALLAPSAERFGFGAAHILAEWAAIVGPKLAAHATPEKLQFPRRAAGAARNGAVLTLAVTPARALDVGYARDAIIARVNAAFGYPAVASIRIVQSGQAAPSAVQLASQPAPTATPTAAGATRLDVALARLARGVARTHGQGAAKSLSNG